MAVLRQVFRNALRFSVNTVITPIVELFQTWTLLSFTFQSKPERQAIIITTGPTSLSIKSEPEQPRENIFVPFYCTYFIR